MHANEGLARQALIRFSPDRRGAHLGPRRIRASGIGVACV